MFSKPIFKQSIQANWKLWVIITFVAAMILSAFTVTFDAEGFAAIASAAEGTRFSNILSTMTSLLGSLENFYKLIAVILGIVCYLFLAALILLFTEPAIETFGDSIWYSFVTSTTTGYGDIVVTTAIGRIVSVILSLYGLLFFGCLSGIVVTYYMEMNKLLPKEEDQK
jgi:voltage-gated potassium channel